jgi:hypothetical protein
MRKSVQAKKDLLQQIRCHLWVTTDGKRSAVDKMAVAIK